MIVRKHNIPTVDTKFDATLCWMDEEKSLSTTNHYLLQQTTRLVSAYVRDLNYKVVINTLHRDKAAHTLKLNEIGRVHIEAASPLFFDEYNRNRETGGFVLIDPATNRSVAAGMLRGQVKTYEAPGGRPVIQMSSNVTWEQRKVTLPMREERNGYPAACLWFTGLSGSGKTTIAKELEEEPIVCKY
jgi:bifunctional enzyme CysN/CysC